MAETRASISPACRGSGPNGRIIKRDVEQAGVDGAEGRAVSAAPRRRAGCPRQICPVTTMRKVIAQRLTEVKPGVPHFYLTIDVEMDQALKLRTRRRRRS